MPCPRWRKSASGWLAWRGGTRQRFHTALNDLATQLQCGLGKIAQPLRVAVTGTAVSPPIDATLALLDASARSHAWTRCWPITAGPLE